MAGVIASRILFDTSDESGSQFSACRRYRYALWRLWDCSLKTVRFVGLNPSTANEYENDMTITKEIGFAKRWGYGGIYKLNLYAYCATDPSEMIQADDPVGPNNDATFNYFRRHDALWVACWGSSVPTRLRPNLQYQSRIDRALNSIDGPVMCLGRTADGSPKHTSRLAYETKLEHFWAPPSDFGPGND